MKIDSLTPTVAVLGELGRRLANVRKQHRLSQEQLAAAAGVGVATVRRLEDGKDGKLGSWLRLLIALRMDAAVDGLLPEDLRSPLVEVKGRRPRRKVPPPSGDFVWGDERP